MYNQDLALNSLQGLIKPQPTKQLNNVNSPHE